MPRTASTPNNTPAKPRTRSQTKTAKASDTPASSGQMVSTGTPSSKQAAGQRNYSDEDDPAMLDFMRALYDRKTRKLSIAGAAMFYPKIPTDPAAQRQWNRTKKNPEAIENARQGLLRAVKGGLLPSLPAVPAASSSAIALPGQDAAAVNVGAGGGTGGYPSVAPVAMASARRGVGAGVGAGVGLDALFAAVAAENNAAAEGGQGGGLKATGLDPSFAAGANAGALNAAGLAGGFAGYGGHDGYAGQGGIALDPIAAAAAAAAAPGGEGEGEGGMGLIAPGGHGGLGANGFGSPAHRGGRQRQPAVIENSPFQSPEGNEALRWLVEAQGVAARQQTEAARQQTEAARQQAVSSKQQADTSKAVSILANRVTGLEVTVGGIQVTVNQNQEQNTQQFASHNKRIGGIEFARRLTEQDLSIGRALIRAYVEQSTLDPSFIMQAIALGQKMESVVERGCTSTTLFATLLVNPSRLELREQGILQTSAFLPFTTLSFEIQSAAGISSFIANHTLLVVKDPEHCFKVPESMAAGEGFNYYQQCQFIYPPNQRFRIIRIVEAENLVDDDVLGFFDFRGMTKTILFLEEDFKDD